MPNPCGARDRGWGTAQGLGGFLTPSPKHLGGADGTPGASPSAAGSRCRTTAARPGSRAAWPCRAPTSAPATPTTTTASANAPRCCREVSGELGLGSQNHPPKTSRAPSPTARSRPAPSSRRLVVRRLRALQPERDLLPGPAQHPQAQRHPLALFPGPQLLAEGHPHADTARGLLARCRTPCRPQTRARPRWN